MTAAPVSRSFPATPDQVRRARRFLAEAMAGSAAADDAVLCLSELATNAILHSRSGGGGSITVWLARAAGRWRVSVGDDGGPWPEHRSGGGLHNRGLGIVAGLSSRWRIDGDGMTGRVVWFEIADEPARPG